MGSSMWRFLHIENGRATLGDWFTAGGVRRLVMLALALALVTPALLLSLSTSNSRPLRTSRFSQTSGPALFVINRDPQGDAIAAFDAVSLQPMGQVEVGGPILMARLLPAGGPIAVMTLIGNPATPVLRLLDPATSMVSDVAPVPDFLQGHPPPDSALLVAPTSPDWITALEEQAASPVASGRFLSNLSADVRNLTTGEVYSVPLHPEADLSVLTLDPIDGRPVIVSATGYHEVAVTDTRAGVSQTITAAPFSTSPLAATVAGSGVWPLRALIVPFNEFNAYAIDRGGSVYVIDLSSGSVNSFSLPIPGVGSAVFAEQVLGPRPTSPFYTVGVVGEDPEGQISSLYFLDQQFSTLGSISGLSAVDFAISPDGTSVAVLWHDGSLSLYSVLDGSLLARAANIVPYGGTIIGIR